MSERQGGGQAKEQTGRFPAVALAGMVVLWAVFVAGRLRPWLHVKPDSATYLALARSLAAGEGYALGGVAHRIYPPAFPFVLSLVTDPLRGHFWPERLVLAGASAGALAASLWLLAGRFRGTRLVVVALLTAASPTFVKFAATLLSDIPFFCLSALFVASATHHWRTSKPSWVWAALAMASLALATLTRVAGVAFHAACIVWLARPGVWRRERRRAVSFAVLFVLVAVPPVVGWAWWVRATRARGSRTYSDYVRRRILKGERLLSAQGVLAVLKKEAETLPHQAALGGEALFRRDADRAAAPWAAPILVCVLLGLLRRLRRAEFMDVCFLAYGLLVLLWTWPQGTRLWLPLVPLLAGYVVEGVAVLRAGVERAGQCARAAARAVGPVALAALLAAAVATDLGMLSGTGAESEGVVGNLALDGANRDVARLLVARRDRPARVACGQALLISFALRGSRARAVPLPFGKGSGPGAALRALRDAGATHLAIPLRLKRGHWLTWSGQAGTVLVEAFPADFREVFRSESVRIVEVVPH